MAASRFQKYTSRKTVLATAVVVVVCAVIVACTIMMAMWNSGNMLPSWVKWNTTTQQLDVNGNNRIETVKLVNRHLTIIDDDGQQYLTPNDWLVSDVRVGDVTADGTPDVIALVWRRDGTEPTYHSPLLGFGSGFSQHLYVFDFSEGSAWPIWTSSPLRFEARALDISGQGEVVIDLSNGSISKWQWKSPGLVLLDKQSDSELLGTDDTVAALIELG